jgi:hypothetical protein
VAGRQSWDVYGAGLCAVTIATLAALTGRGHASAASSGPATRRLVAKRFAATAATAAQLSVDARLLLIGVSGHEAATAAMKHELDYLGTPYTVVPDATSLSAAVLADSATHGLFDGVIQAACDPTADIGATDATGTLSSYLATFQVRAACLYARPDPAWGLGAAVDADTRTSSLSLQFTNAGTAVFGWYASTAPVTVSGVAAALAAPSDATTTPLLVDGAGRAGLAIHRFSDGRELMLLGFDQAQGALHSQQLMTGVASWLAHGVFVGEKRAFFGPQLDDIFLGTVMEDGTTFRMSADDMRNVARWEQQVRATTLGAGVTLAFPFNGAEVTDADQLTAAAREVGSQFAWLSHTFDHHRLDAADYPRMTMELTSNDAVMTKYAFGPYDRTSLITPDVSGLANAPVMQAAVDFGIRQVVCDASTTACQPPPNTGLANPAVPAMFMVPRVSTNLYANVSTPTEWVSSYDALIPNSSGPAFSYDQIIDRESGPLVTHMLEGDIDPWMFHQSNLRAYDGMHTLFTDLADRLLAQYQALRVLPIISLSMAEIAARMQDRAALQSAGLVATIGPGRTITLRAASAVRVPVTGARGSNAETYGQVTISMVDVPAGGQISLPLVTAAPAPDGGATPSSAPPSSPGDAAVTATLTTTPTSMSGGGCGCVAAGDLQSSPAAGWWAAALVALLWTARALRPKRRPAIT